MITLGSYLFKCICVCVPAYLYVHHMSEVVCVYQKSMLDP